VSACVFLAPAPGGGRVFFARAPKHGRQAGLCWLPVWLGGIAPAPDAGLSLPFVLCGEGRLASEPNFCFPLALRYELELAPETDFCLPFVLLAGMCLAPDLAALVYYSPALVPR